MKRIRSLWSQKEDPFALEVSMFFHPVHMSEPVAVSYFLHLTTTHDSKVRSLVAATELKADKFKEAFKLVQQHYRVGEYG